MFQTTGQQYLAWFHIDSPPRQQAGTDLFHQIAIVVVGTEGRPLRYFARGKDIPGAFTPFAAGIQSRVVLVTDERKRILQPVRGARLQGAAADGDRIAVNAPETPIVFATAGQFADVVANHALLGHGLTHVKPTAFTGNQKTVIHQLLVGQHHGVARNTQLLGHTAGRGHFMPGGNTAGENTLDKFFADLLLQAFVCGGIEDNECFAHVRLVMVVMAFSVGNPTTRWLTLLQFARQQLLFQAQQPVAAAAVAQAISKRQLLQQPCV